MNAKTILIVEDDPVLLRQGMILAATFHPELTPGSPVVDLFVRQVRAAG